MAYCDAPFMLPLFCSPYSTAVYLWDPCLSDNNVVRPPGDAVSVMPGFVALFIPLNNLPPAPSISSYGYFIRAINPILFCPVPCVLFIQLRLQFSIHPSHL